MEGHVPVPGARLYFREIGSGVPVVILHGGPDFNHRYLLPEMDGLAGGCRLIYYDRRGRGKSSPGIEPADVTIESEISDLDFVRRHAGVESIALLGHSWGAVLAMEYASRHPDHVSHLILLNPAPASAADAVAFRKHRVRNEAESIAAMRAIAKTPEYVAGDIEAEARYYRAHFSAAISQPEQLEEIIRRLRVDFAPEDIVKARAIESRLYAQTWSVPGYDVAAALNRFSAPTLVVHGARDFIPRECATRIAHDVAGAKLVVLEGCGHFAHLERPAEVRDLILDFLSSRRGTIE